MPTNAAYARLGGAGSRTSLIPSRIGWLRAKAASLTAASAQTIESAPRITENTVGTRAVQSVGRRAGTRPFEAPAFSAGRDPLLVATLVGPSLRFTRSGISERERPVGSMSVIGPVDQLIGTVVCTVASSMSDVRRVKANVQSPGTVRLISPMECESERTVIAAGMGPRPRDGSVATTVHCWILIGWPCRFDA